MKRSSRFRNGVLLSTSLAAGWLAIEPMSAFAQSATSSTTTDSKSSHARKRPVKRVSQPVATSGHSVTTTSPTTPAAQVTTQNRKVLSAATVEPTAQPESIVVTGTLFRDPNMKSASPITHITAADLQQHIRRAHA